MKVIDFCCGAGGGTLGIQQAGGVVVRAFDLNATPLDTHNHQHPGVSQQADLLRYDFRDLPQHDVALWCPPCEEVSTASGRTAYGAQVPLMGRVLQYLDACRPTHLLFENVPPITGWRGYFEWRCSIERAGYWVTDGVVQAADFVPQERSRLILMASRGTRAPRLPAATRVNHSSARRLIDLDLDRPDWRPVGGASPAQKSRIQRARQRFGEAFLLASSGVRGGASGDHNGRSLERPMATVTTSRQWLVINGYYMRNITPEECAHAQGFPKNYRFKGNLAEQQAQVGRAIPVPLARAAFKALVS